MEVDLYLDLAKRLSQQAQRQQYRYTLLLSGEARWCREVAKHLTEEMAEEFLWVGEQGMTHRQAQQHLGQECEWLVYDAHSGFNPDSFGAITGTLRGGGLLVLLTPELSQWPSFDDPEYQRLLVANSQRSDIKGRFIQHLVRVLDKAPGVTICHQKGGVSEAALAVVPDKATHPPSPYLTEEQQQAVQAIHHVMSGHRRRPLVLTSDRGRGKSGALGLAAAQLLQQGVKTILLTAPCRDALQSVFAQAYQQLPQAEWHGNCLRWQQGQLIYIAPDQLLAEKPPAELLMVDEAAAIPVGILQQMLGHYSRMVFATTIHGYEGSGRGFAIRFQRYLNQYAPGWQGLHLKQPIRWAEQDPLEKLVFRALCLDAEVAELVESKHPPTIRKIERDELLEQPPLLAQLFGLLVSAHYRTSPSDLRNLLDGPNLHIYLMQQYEGGVVGALLLAAEGGFSDELAQQVQQGRRRPRGHLLAQSLTAQLGLVEGAQLRSARVMRIAIHPTLQRKGLGAELLEFVRQDCRDKGFDLLGASFGASSELLAFWRHQGLVPVLLGMGQESSSGAHAALMLQPLNESGERCFQQARQQGRKLLLSQLNEPLQTLQSDVALALLQQQPALPAPILDGLDRVDLHHFAYHQRGYELSLHLLRPLAEWALVNQTGELSEAQQRLLLYRVLQQRSWDECARLSRYAGRKPLLAALREIFQQLEQAC